MKKDKSIVYENWSTLELFNYLILQDVFPEEEVFDYWRTRRNELLNLCKSL